MKIPPATKYSLGRVGLFVLFFVVLLPVPMDMLPRLLFALVASAVLSWFALSRWRNEMGATIEKSLAARRAEKEKLRAALAGDDDPNPPTPSR